MKNVNIITIWNGYDILKFYSHLRANSIAKKLESVWTDLKHENICGKVSMKKYKKSAMKTGIDKDRKNLKRHTVTQASKQHSTYIVSKLQLTNDLTSVENPEVCESLTSSETSVLTPSTPVSSNSSLPTSVFSTLPAISKPPKKRYLENGTFCHKENNHSMPQDSQITSACLTLLELAKACSTSTSCDNFTSLTSAHSTSHSSINSKKHTSLVNGISTTATNIFTEYSSPPLSCVANNASHITGGCIPQPNPASHRLSLLSSKTEPLNLCTDKKMVHTNHQQIIDKLVDKFLRQPHGTSSNIPIDSSVFAVHSPELDSNSHKNSRTLKDGNVMLPQVIASVIETAYNCLSQPDIPDTLSSKSGVITNGKAALTDSSDMQKTPCPSMTKEEKIAVDSVKKDDINLQKPARSTEFEAKIPIVSPPKKSHALREALSPFVKSLSEVSGPSDESNIPENMAGSEFSPTFRRKSQRSCKGRRYQEFLSEGLLQPVKERRPSNRKPSVTEDCDVSDSELMKEAKTKGFLVRQSRKRTSPETSTNLSPKKLGNAKKTEAKAETRLVSKRWSLRRRPSDLNREQVKIRNIPSPPPYEEFEAKMENAGKNKMDKFSLEVKETQVEHFKDTEVQDDNDLEPPLVGSQKRKARKKCIARLNPDESNMSVVDWDMFSGSNGLVALAEVAVSLKNKTD